MVNVLASDEVLLEAVNWLAQGIAVIPLWPRTKNPAVRTWKEYQDRLPELEKVLTWFRLPRNLAVITGWQGLTVIDFDRRDLFLDWWNETGIETRMVSTSRGIHVYTFLEELPAVNKLEGIDIQSHGRYVLAPPSIHPSGEEYSLILDAPIMRARRLEDVLPAEFWQAKDNDRPPANTERALSEALPKMPVHQEPASGDLWRVAMNIDSRPLAARIKDRISILDFFPDAKPTGKGWFIACCPLHDDHNPSLWIDANRGLCGCYAGCNDKPMDVVNLYARWKQLSNSEAMRVLAKRL